MLDRCGTATNRCVGGRGLRYLLVLHPTPYKNQIRPQREQARSFRPNHPRTYTRSQAPAIYKDYPRCAVQDLSPRYGNWEQQNSIL